MFFDFEFVSRPKLACGQNRRLAARRNSLEISNREFDNHFQIFKIKIFTTPAFLEKVCVTPHWNPAANRRETSRFPDPTPLRYNVRSEDYTGQRDYAARLRYVPSFRQTGWTHSPNHLCLTPRRQAAHRAALRPPTP